MKRSRLYRIALEQNKAFERRRTINEWMAIVMLGCFVGLSFFGLVINPNINSPEPIKQKIEVNAEEVTTKPTPSVVEQIKDLKGIASYYSETGCLGCSPTLTMANGQRLDDDKYTIALLPKDYRKFRNVVVTVINPKTGLEVNAKVTDTGGFGKYNRIADLSKATKEAIGCNDLCNVIIKIK